MTALSSGDRLSRSIFRDAIEFTGQRWLELVVLVVGIYWAPMIVFTLLGDRYVVGSRDVGAFASSLVVHASLATCSSFMLASVVALGLGRAESVSALGAVRRTFRNLPALAPWWVALNLPLVLAEWIRWSFGSPSAFLMLRLPMELGSAVYETAIFCALGLFSFVVLAEQLSAPAALRRSLDLMARRRGPILAVSVAIGVIDLIATVATPYLTLFAVDVGLGRSGIYLAVFGASLLEIIVTAVGNLALVQLYFRIARAHDGVAPGEVEHLFA